MFYYCNPRPPRGARALEAQAMCPTLETHVLRVTSHTRFRVVYTSSTLIGGKGAAGPSSLHPTLEGPPKYVNARWV